MYLDVFCFFFFFNDTATTEIYTLSLHDALPILLQIHRPDHKMFSFDTVKAGSRSEEHTSELQSHHELVCRLLLEKKKTDKQAPMPKTNTKAATLRTTTETAT